MRNIKILKKSKVEFKENFKQNLRLGWIYSFLFFFGKRGRDLFPFHRYAATGTLIRNFQTQIWPRGTKKKPVNQINSFFFFFFFPIILTKIFQRVRKNVNKFKGVNYYRNMKRKKCTQYTDMIREVMRPWNVSGFDIISLHLKAALSKNFQGSSSAQIKFDSLVNF